MKKGFLFPLSLLAIAAVSFITPPNPLAGRWQQMFKGVTALLVFRTDDTFDAFVNGKLFTSGKYTVRQDTLFMADNSCNMAYYGTYKLGFYAPDSVRFTTIADTCRGRNGDLHNFTVGRVKPVGANSAKP